MRLRNSLLFLTIAAAPLTLQAGRPTIIVNGDPPNPIIVVNDNFTFGADTLGGGDFTFQNASGTTWNSLLFTATLPIDTPIVCGPGPFQLCTVTTKPQSDGSFLYDILMGPAQTGGITNGEVFSVDLNDSGTDPTGAGSWGAGTDFTATANTTPEPSAIFLVIAGLAGFVGWRRFQRKPLLLK
ncbi:MAG TPA: PEP-CTERM sorting domain-containing protein [Bryobacteraceae bacterium]|jgi:hypothetical protein|nr:PEP-CTERM sorting domain-containing protein [Bryobacteraceae bacterium]